MTSMIFADGRLDEIAESVLTTDGATSLPFFPFSLEVLFDVSYLHMTSKIFADGRVDENGILQ